jgi:hypothetical protein
MANVKGKLDNGSNKSNKDKDKLNSVTNAFVTLLADINDTKE